jgi:hypothetical protein
MSDNSQVVRVYGCRWAWCRLNFSDNDGLRNHVVFEHVRRAIPVRRKDILMLRRAEEGLGDSLKISDIMRDPSSSLSQKSELSKGIVLVAAEHRTRLKQKMIMKLLLRLSNSFRRRHRCHLRQLQAQCCLRRTRVSPKI